MKKTTIILSVLTMLAYIGCNMQEKKEEQPNVEQAIEQMTQALDTTTAIAPVTDSSATK